MVVYTLYVKTHRKTGLKYLGYTKKEDPHKYTGSGIDWVEHLIEHGVDYDTEILLQTADKDEIKKQGLYYSHKWDIVKSKDWANRKLEEGDGGSTNQGTQGWNNGIKNMYSDQCPGPEWVKGIIQEKLAWYNNGTLETKFANHPGGTWQPGRLIGKKIWNNGLTECRSFTPPGKEWSIGRLNSANRQRGLVAMNGGKTWWNNRIKNKKSLDCPGPGWRPGMMPKNRA